MPKMQVSFIFSDTKASATVSKPATMKRNLATPYIGISVPSAPTKRIFLKHTPNSAAHRSNNFFATIVTAAPVPTSAKTDCLLMF